MNVYQRERRLRAEQARAKQLSLSLEAEIRELELRESIDRLVQVILDHTLTEGKRRSNPSSR